MCLVACQHEALPAALHFGCHHTGLSDLGLFALHPHTGLSDSGLAAFYPHTGLPDSGLSAFQVQRTREVQRAGRRRSGKPVLAVVGYTNAGKSSLLQALTKTDTGVEDRYLQTA